MSVRFGLTIEDFTPAIESPDLGHMWECDIIAGLGCTDAPAWVIDAYATVFAEIHGQVASTFGPGDGQSASSRGLRSCTEGAMYLARYEQVIGYPAARHGV